MSANDGSGGGAVPPNASESQQLKIIKTQLIPHSMSLQQQQQHLAPLQSSANQQSIPISTTVLTSTQSVSVTPAPHNLSMHLSAHTPIQLAKSSNLISLNPVAAKTGGAISIGGGGLVGSAGGTIMTAGGAGLSAAAGAIKVATGGTVTTSIALSSGQSTTATAIRAIGAGGQSTQVRVVVPTGNFPPSMIKQLEGAAAAGRTQITAIPATAARTVSNTSTVTRPVTQTTYLPRAAVTANQMSGVGMTGGQRLVTPIRTAPAGGVTGLTAAGSFVRGTAVSRNSASPATTVISPATTTWMAANTGVQLIRAIPHQSRQRIITTQGIGNAVGGGGTTVSSVGGAVVASAVQAQQTSGSGSSATIQAISSQASSHSQQQQQQTYVATLATVLPQRQHQATLVYSSNVATSQPLSQPQQFNPTVAGAQRFAVATPLTATVGTVGGPRQIRPILGKSFSTAKLNTTSISIRAPNLPQLTPTLTGTTIAGVNSAGRSNTVSGTAASIIPTANLPTTRIIQLQQQPGGATQQLIGSTGRLSSNVMLQPIIVNTSATGKLGLRPPVTMAGKVQPSLTITQLGIGKLPAAANVGATVGQQQQQQQQQNVTASIQAISCGSVNSDGAISINTTPTSTVVTGGGGQLSVAASTAQLTAASQLLAAQNIVSSALTTRGASGGNIITGTITPIKNAITVGKLMTPTQLTAQSDAASGGGTATGVYIHHAGSAAQQLQQRAHSQSGSSTTVTLATTTPPASAAGGGGPTAHATTTVLTTTGSGGIGANNSAGSGGGPYLPPGTIYYESLPASSTGVLSLSTTTVTSSTVSQSQIVSSASNLMPFATHAANSTATFTVVPSSGGRAIGQLQLPKANVSGGAQIQAVPVRFSAQLTASSSGGNNSVDTITVSQAAVAAAVTSHLATGPQLIIPASHQQGVSTTTTLSAAVAQGQQHMVIPLHTSIKVTSTGGGGGVGGNNTIVSNFLRKRDSDGSPIRAAKNLGPAIFSMAAANVLSSSGGGMAAPSGSAPAPSLASGSFSVTSTNTCTAAVAPTSALTTEALAKKDRAAAATAVLLRAESPVSSDGSTTVSANSSPGVEQQMQDGNMVLNHRRDATHFNPINELYANHHSMTTMQHHMGDTPPRSSIMDAQQRHSTGSTTMQRLNGAPIDCPPRKKSRRLTNDSQHSSQSQFSFTLPPPSGSALGSGLSNATAVIGSSGLGGAASDTMASGGAAIVGNKENAKPLEFILRRPSNCTLLNGYKSNWKPANNHFQRYSDVKPREERRPTVIDLANQANVLGKINGWKIYHLCSQMEDLCENESLGYEKLSEMLKQMETTEKSPDIERISELLKGNMQRSKIIVDGVNEAQNQMMKIFEHKSHISDIIHRCASKRNFKKREKL